LDGFENVDKLERWLDSSIGQQEGGGGASDPNEVFAHSLGYLIKEFQIGDRWLWALCAYIFFGETKWHDLLPNPVKLESNATPDIEGDGKYIDVRVYPEATREDLVGLWKDIKLGRSLNEMDRQSTIYLKGISVRDMENRDKLVSAIEEFSNTHNQRHSLLDSDKLKRNIRALKLKRDDKDSKEIAQILMDEGFVEEVCIDADINNYLRDIRQRVEKSELT
jgi:hypothetical protein